MYYYSRHSLLYISLVIFTKGQNVLFLVFNSTVYCLLSICYSHHTVGVSKIIFNVLCYFWYFLYSKFQLYSCHLESAASRCFCSWFILWANHTIQLKCEKWHSPCNQNGMNAPYTALTKIPFWCWWEHESWLVNCPAYRKRQVPPKRDPLSTLRKSISSVVYRPRCI